MDWNFATVFESVADAIPDSPALVQDDRRRTWHEFDERAARLAAAFRALGLGPDSKVAFYLYNSNEYLETLFATFKLRAVPANVNYRYTADELAYLLDNSDAEVVVFHGSLGDRVDAVRDPNLKVRATVQVDDGSPLVEGAVRYEDLVGAHEPMERIERSGDDVIFLYTGGTTGMPKAVMWRHEDLFAALAPLAYSFFGLDMPDNSKDAGSRALKVHESGLVPVHLPASPLMHGTGQFSTLQALFLGGRIVTLESRHFDPDELWRVVQHERVSQIAIVGDAFAKPMLRALDEADARGEPYDLSSLLLVISSGVMWSESVKRELIERHPVIAYDSLGSSEGVGFANAITTTDSKGETAKFSVGPNTKVFTDDDREVKPGSGEVGYLAVGGNIPLGYYKDRAKTKSTFREVDGKRYSIPGDYATVEEDGTVTLLGRGSVSINSGGEKIFPEEVEEAVKQHSEVADVVVVGVPDERFGEAVTAVVAPTPGGTPDEEEIAAAVERSGLARFKRPRHVVVVDAVPRGPNGKADYAWARDTARARVPR
ncbi:MAG TPA: AMP-binding protein [Acidimicrobiia bacterium]|nr:AMP-binding protein [Acidimicrobiia bacterium]